MRITLKNFKNHLETGVQLEGITAIEGRNGSGKTSLLEAILYALYGRDFYGGIATDGFNRKGSKGCAVTLDYNGNTYRRADGMVFYNGVKQRHTDLLSRLPSLEMAYMVVNPLYMLASNKLLVRQLIMQNTPLPDPVKIFKEKYSDKEELVNRFREGTYEESKGFLKELTNSYVAMQKQLELKEAELYSTVSAHQQTKEQRVRMPAGVIVRERERQVKIDELSKKLEAIGDVQTALNEIRDRLQVITEEVTGYLKDSKTENLTQLVEFYESSYDKVMDEYRRLEVRASQLGVSRHELDGVDKCPTCGSEVVWEDFVKRNESELFITKSLMEKLAPQVDELKNTLVGLRALKHEVSELQSREFGLKSKLSEYRNLRKKIDGLRAMQKGLSEESFKKAVESEAQKKMIKVLLDRARLLRIKITEIKASIKTLEAELKSASLIVEALSPKGVSAYQAAYVGEVVAKRLVEYFPGRKVEVFTIRRNKSNDNVREVFEIRVDGVLWSELSFGERIVIAIAMGLVLRESVGEFPLKFVLLDEASVLSSDTMARIQELLKKNGIEFFYTLAKDSDFKLIKY